MTTKKYLKTPKQVIDLNIPASQITVKVSCIDSTTRVTLRREIFLQPDVAKHDTLKCPAYSYLIEHEASGQKVLFDLGVRQDWENLAPGLVKRVKAAGFKVTIEKNVSEILTELGYALENINAIIWSHHHWDHVGDPSTFPRSTELVVGPGFKAAFTPGYPTNPEAPILVSDYDSRPFREIDIKKEGGEMKIGRFYAYDYFGDNSFFLLDTPGHATGHMCGLARVTSGPDSYIFFGGDACHHGGEFRPTEYMPLPIELTPTMLARIKSPCPGSIFQDVHPEGAADEPFYKLVKTFPENLELAEWTIDGVEEFDGHPNILTAIAHDNTFLGQLEMFPSSMNAWKSRGEREKVFWRFLDDFEVGTEENT